MRIIEANGFILYDGVPIGSVERLAYEDAALARGLRRADGHLVLRAGFRGGKRLSAELARDIVATSEGQHADGGEAFRAFSNAIASETPEQRGAREGAARAWARYTFARSTR